MNCEDCDLLIKYGEGSGRIHRTCRGKRAGKVNREKAEKHGPAYFDRRSADARR